MTEARWQNTQILRSDVPDAVERLRAKVAGEIRVGGSTQLIRTLAAHDLVDEYRLAWYPIVLGSGKTLFPAAFPLSRLALAETRALRSSVVVSAYRRAQR